MYNNQQGGLYWQRHEKAVKDLRIKSCGIKALQQNDICSCICRVLTILSIYELEL